MKNWFSSLSLGAKVAWIIAVLLVAPTTGYILGVKSTATPNIPTSASNPSVLSATIAPTITATQPVITRIPVPTPTVTPSPIPTPIATPALSNSNNYTNVDGNQVHSPAYSQNNLVPSGATAICSDGTYSFSQNHRGTCSHHGGVAQWL